MRRENGQKWGQLVLLPTMLLFAFFQPLVCQDEGDVDKLLEMSIEELLQVKVSVASKSEEEVKNAPGIVSVITRQEIESFAARNLGDILNRIVGTSFLSPNVFRENVVMFRGQGLTPYNNHTLILINGRPARDPITGGLNMSLYTSFPVETIEKIEVIRGPGSVLYGSTAFSGVINIVTSVKEEEGESLTVQTGAGSYGAFSQKVNILFRSDSINWNIGIHHFEDDGPELSFADSLGKTSTNEFNRKNLGIYANLNFGDLNVQALMSDFESFTLNGGTNGWEWKKSEQQKSHLTHFIDIGYKHEMEENIFLETNLTYNRHSWDQSESANMTASDLLMEIAFNVQLTEDFSYVLGSVADRTEYSGKRFIDNDILDTSFYTQLEYTSGDSRLIGGLQWNLPDGLDGHFSPRLGLIHHFSRVCGMKILHSEAFRKGYPLETSFKHWLLRGNLKLRPELISTTEVQVFYSTSSHEFSITGYYSRMSNIIVRKWVETSKGKKSWGYMQYDNGGHHDFWGMEVEDKFKISDSFFILGSFLWQENEMEDVRNASLHPNYIGKVGAFYNSRRFTLGLWNNYFGTPYDVPDVKRKNPEPRDHNLLSILVKYKTGFGLTITLEGMNILDEYVTYPDYSNKSTDSLLPLYEGRMFYTTLTYVFD